jgi:hypothetical protein
MTWLNSLYSSRVYVSWTHVSVRVRITMLPSGSKPKSRIERDRMLSGSRLATPPPAEADQAFSLPFGGRGLQSKRDQRVRRGAAPALLVCDPAAVFFHVDASAVDQVEGLVR